MLRDTVLWPGLALLGTTAIAGGAYVLSSPRTEVETRYQTVVVPVLVAPPAPAPAPSHTRAVTCVPHGADLVLTDETVPALCDAKECLELDGNDSWVPAAEPVEESAEPPPKQGKLDGRRLCFGERCAKVGPNLAADIVEHGESDPVATADFGAVLVGDHAWNVRRDQLLRPRAPKVVMSGNRMNLDRIDVAGKHLLLHWAECAGPCARGQLVDSSGRNVGGEIGGGGHLTEVTPSTFVNVSENAVLQVLVDGTLTGSIDLGQGAVALDSRTVAVGQDTVVVMLDSGTLPGGKRVYTVSLRDGRPSVEGERFFPDCE